MLLLFVLLLVQPLGLEPVSGGFGVRSGPSRAWFWWPVSFRSVGPVVLLVGGPVGWGFPFVSGLWVGVGVFPFRFSGRERGLVGPVVPVLPSSKWLNPERWRSLH